MTCCTPAGYRTIFGSRAAERDARRYRRNGLTGTARWLAATLERTGVADRSVLEIGGGIGALQVELLEAGASQATNVEIIDTYESVAHTLLVERGLDERVERRVADFASAGDETPPADLLILHRVICCYPDAGVLVEAACAHAHERVAITIPREFAWIRLGFAAMNGWFRLRRIGFRGYVHPLDPMLAVAGRGGFHVAVHERGPIWQSFILQRS
jgi:hypothetical protein